MVALMLAWLLLSQVLLSTGSGVGARSTSCAAADSLMRLGDFFARNVKGVDADGYLGLAFASMALDTAPLTAVAARVGADCGEAQLVELARTAERIGLLQDGFRARVSTDSSGYDGVTYREICRPLEVLFRRRLRPGVFRWRGFADSDKDAVDREIIGSGGGNSTDSRDWLAANAKRLQHYNEAVGDKCFRVLLAATKRCPVPLSCRWLFLNSGPTSGYWLTHQLMYFFVAIDKHCHLKLSNGRPVDWSLLHGMCRRSYAEYRRILGLGQAGFEFIDLAIEQAVLCGLLGYRDFFMDSTTLLLRRLQSEHLGCFEDSLVDKETDASTTGTATARIGRKLMHNVVLEGSCSSHTSGLAAAYFALFLRT